MLRPKMGNTAGSTFTILGDDKALSDGVSAYLTAGGVATGNENLGNASLASTTFLSDIGAILANHPGALGEMPPSDVWVLVLGPGEEKIPVGALKQSLAQFRKVAGTKSAPAEIAKALNEGKEEWVRSSADDATSANDAWKALTATSIADINAAFPTSA